ncbi:hypothetical protein C9426_03570 [Serratia sp. S1B]|nr:hypothetical protein C9426_03570 [Serratia sp. S1B]
MTLNENAGSYSNDIGFKSACFFWLNKKISLLIEVHKQKRSVSFQLNQSLKFVRIIYELAFLSFA